MPGCGERFSADFARSAGGPAAPPAGFPARLRVFSRQDFTHQETRARPRAEKKKDLTNGAEGEPLARPHRVQDSDENPEPLATNREPENQNQNPRTSNPRTLEPRLPEIRDPPPERVRRVRSIGV